MFSLHFNSLLRALAAVLIVCLSTTLATAASKQKVHVVAPGHTLGKIAKRYHVTIEALCKANGITRRTKLRPGTRLVIPSRHRHHEPPSTSRNRAKNDSNSDSLDADTPMTSHVVARGHSLAKIARRYRTTITALRQANHLEPGQRLRIGQCLLVPLTRRSPKRARRRPWPCKPDGVIEKKGKNNKVRLTIDRYARRPRRPGIVTIVRGNTSWTGRLVTRRSHRPRPSALAILRKLMFDRRTGETHAIAPRLANVLTRISDHFGGRPIHIISGYRGPKSNPYTPHSNHRKGRAVDFTIPGVPKEAIRDFCHTLDRVGVGYYPNSSFIHVDVRNVTTHWVDISKPGQRPIYTSINGTRKPGRTDSKPAAKRTGNQSKPKKESATNRAAATPTNANRRSSSEGDADAAPTE